MPARPATGSRCKRFPTATRSMALTGEPNEDLRMKSKVCRSLTLEHDAKLPHLRLRNNRTAPVLLSLEMQPICQHRLSEPGKHPAWHGRAVRCLRFISHPVGHAGLALFLHVNAAAPGTSLGVWGWGSGWTAHQSNSTQAGCFFCRSDNSSTSAAGPPPRTGKVRVAELHPLPGSTSVYSQCLCWLSCLHLN